MKFVTFCIQSFYIHFHSSCERLSFLTSFWQTKSSFSLGHWFQQRRPQSQQFRMGSHIIFFVPVGMLCNSLRAIATVAFLGSIEIWVSNARDSPATLLTPLITNTASVLVPVNEVIRRVRFVFDSKGLAHCGCSWQWWEELAFWWGFSRQFVSEEIAWKLMDRVRANWLLLCVFESWLILYLSNDLLLPMSIRWCRRRNSLGEGSSLFYLQILKELIHLLTLEDPK
jgi:hypothetical protein